MAATSRHYLDILLWVKKVIKSIDHPLQDAGAKKLIRNYFKMYGHKFKSNEINEIERDLRMELDVVKYKRKKKLNNNE
jgi:hypothetical protein